MRAVVPEVSILAPPRRAGRLFTSQVALPQGFRASSPRTPRKQLIPDASRFSPPSPNPRCISACGTREPPRSSGTTPGSRPTQITCSCMDLARPRRPGARWARRPKSNYQRCLEIDLPLRPEALAVLLLRRCQPIDPQAVDPLVDQRQQLALQGFVLH